MHLAVDEIRELADAYISRNLLSDEQFAMKLHMASCEECYKKFLAAYFVQEKMLEQGMIGSYAESDQALLEMEPDETELKKLEKDKIYMEMDAYE